MLVVVLGWLHLFYVRVAVRTPDVSLLWACCRDLAAVSQDVSPWPGDMVKAVRS